ncbi:hypothetical protein FRZ67_04690 [Panacibacter ginsenosidivorans]|uniref:Uncharacterized protein n=1 Tax=Panacibacter ginsenosidivorans TaxID=1813871 RepID=A0A5B8V616_9BACT|nr:hypothetical protein [Panacibacter ginsenosidivorans]QEC66629.1 hypothetical protein FRZ67_04690 [Panacibacter ginsenosidivorans]
MTDKIKIETDNFKQIDESDAAIEQKLHELELLLAQTELDSEKIKYYKQRVDDTFDKSRLNRNIDIYQSLDDKTFLSADDRLDQLINLLAENPVDSTIIKKRKNTNWIKKIILIIIALLMITIGFTMIVLPAPPEFEMFTIYYFNRDDGVTLMDLISLLIIFGGVFLLITSMKRRTSDE